MEILFSILTVIGMGYGVYRGLKWMMSSGLTNARKEQPLTPNDLKILEESAARLMADLRSVADECVAKVDSACSRAELRLNELQSNTVSANSSVKQQQTANKPVPQLYEMIELDEHPAGVMAYAGMTKGEIELMQGLELIGNQ